MSFCDHYNKDDKKSIMDWKSTSHSYNNQYYKVIPFVKGVEIPNPVISQVINEESICEDKLGVQPLNDLVVNLEPITFGKILGRNIIDNNPEKYASSFVSNYNDETKKIGALAGIWNRFPILPIVTVKILEGKKQVSWFDYFFKPEWIDSNKSNSSLTLHFVRLIKAINLDIKTIIKSKPSCKYEVFISLFDINHTYPPVGPPSSCY